MIQKTMEVQHYGNRRTHQEISDKKKKLTQRELGVAVGLSEHTADVRMAQYESGTRTPKADLTEKLAGVLGVSPHAISVPDIDSYVGLMHTLFALEDLYGFEIVSRDGEINLRLDPSSRTFLNLIDDFRAWHEQAELMRKEEITKEDYDNWRYNFPKSMASQEQAMRDALRADH